MATAPPASTPGPAPSSGRDNAVGIALIVGAVLIGLFLLVKGYDSEGGVVAEDKVSTETTTTTAPVESTTTTTTVAAKPPAEVVVKVANASGQSGVASSTRTTLQGEGLHPGLRRRRAQHRDQHPGPVRWRGPRPTPRPSPPPSAWTPPRWRPCRRPLRSRWVTPSSWCSPAPTSPDVARRRALPELLAPFVADPAGVGVFTDFDGTLSPIVDEPDAAVPLVASSTSSRTWPGASPWWR